MNIYQLQVQTQMKMLPKDYLSNKVAMATLLTGLLESGNLGLLAGVLGEMCKDIGMPVVAEKTGIAREALYRALRYTEKCQPRFKTIMKVLDVLGLQFKAIPMVK